MKIAVNDIQMYYEEYGAGAPLVLLHGFPLDHTIWQPVVTQLAGTARLIVPDLRGHGQTDAPGGVYSMAGMARDVAGLLDRLEIPQAVLVGHSMGGYAALAFARDFPERLSGLGLVASQAAADSPERRAGRFQSIQEVELAGSQAIAAVMANRLVAHKELVPQLEKIILGCSPVGIIGTLRGLAERPDMTAFLPQIRVPAVIVAGEVDALIPAAQAEQMAKTFVFGSLVMIPGVGHMPMLEAPESTARAIMRLVLP